MNKEQNSYLIQLVKKKYRNDDKMVKTRMYKMYKTDILMKGTKLGDNYKTILHNMVFNKFKSKYWSDLKKDEKNRAKAITKLSPNTNIKCFDCNKKKVYTWQLQLRSADEPVTVFFKCLNCFKMWKK